jgi:hypothetical protein
MSGLPDHQILRARVTNLYANYVYVVSSWCGKRFNVGIETKDQVGVLISPKEASETGDMAKPIRFVSSMLLTGALLAPVAFAQDRDHDRDDRNRNNNRVYDSSHRDYHNWNSDEDNAYRQWYGQQHNGKQYRDYRKLNKKDQQAYWKWRHNNENDRDRDHDKDRDRH